MKVNNVVDFIAHCIAQAEADGYQQFEEEGNEIPDNAVPDNWEVDAKRIWLKFGSEEFLVSVSKPRH